MRFLTTAACVLAGVAALAGNVAAHPFDRVAEPLGDDGTYGLAADCVLRAYDACSCWTWVFTERAGAEWGAVFDADECPGGCGSGAKLTDVWFFSRCITPPALPRTIGGVRVHSVDALGCRTGLLWNSGPLTVTHCTTTDGWTHVTVPAGGTLVGSNPFAISIKQGVAVAGTDTRFRFVSDNGIANLYCSQGTPGFPGCETPACSCPGWAAMIPPQRSYIYVQDYDLDGDLDDLCVVFGEPYSLAFPNVPPYGYLPNNLLIRAGLTCALPASVKGGALVDPSSWGRVKVLFD